ncbi:hypothetical protein ABKV19_014933 [Rosa sericea]
MRARANCSIQFPRSDSACDRLGTGRRRSTWSGTRRRRLFQWFGPSVKLVVEFVDGGRFGYSRVLEDGAESPLDFWNVAQLTCYSDTMVCILVKSPRSTATQQYWISA